MSSTLSKIIVVLWLYKNEEQVRHVYLFYFYPSFGERLAQYKLSRSPLRCMIYSSNYFTSYRIFVHLLRHATQHFIDLLCFSKTVASTAASNQRIKTRHRIARITLSRSTPITNDLHMLTARNHLPKNHVCLALMILL